MNSIDFKKELNESQYKAVVHDFSPAVVIAGAGSGKTRVITYRIAYLLSQRVEPYNVLGLTFTNKAANEMKERIASLLGDSRKARSLMLGTFHSVFNRILRNEAHVLGYKPDYSIYTPDDAYVLIREIVAAKELDSKKYDARNVFKRISYLKNYMYTPDRYESNPELVKMDKINKREAFADIFRLYESKKKKNNAMDFDDLLLNTYFLFRNNNEILAKYKEQYSHILIDEFQDTNLVQYEITKLLADKDTDIMVVGDDAQSIYSFRGAVVQNVYKFIKEFDAKVFMLKQNYRSTQHIVLASNVLISKNKEQIQKNVISNKGYGSKIYVKETDYDSDEAEFVARDIKRRIYSYQKRYEDFAVLYRINSQSRKVEEALRRENIPYKVYGGMSFYNRKEIKDVLAYLFYINNPNDTVAFSRIINFPKRGIGDTTVKKILAYAEQNNVPLDMVIRNIEEFSLLPSRTRNLVKAFRDDMDYFRKKQETATVADITKEIVEKFGITAVFKDMGEDEKAANVEELLNSMYDFVDSMSDVEGDEEPDVSLRAYLETVSLVTDNDEPDDDDNKVKLMTVHTAKGLEFDTVYIVGAEEQLFPIGQSFESQERVNEERRLFYVAMTRAMENLIITFSRVRFKYNQVNHTTPSRFLADLPKENIHYDGIEPVFDKKTPAGGIAVPGNGNINEVKKDVYGSAYSHEPQRLKKITTTTREKHLDAYGDIKVGSRVKHEKFGVGTVLELTGGDSNTKAVIEFETAGRKTLLLKFARLMVVG